VVQNVDASVHTPSEAGSLRASGRSWSRLSSPGDHSSLRKHLKIKSSMEYTGPEYYVAQLLEKQDIGFFPIGQASKVRSSSDAQAASNMLMQRQQAQTQLGTLHKEAAKREDLDRMQDQLGTSLRGSLREELRALNEEGFLDTGFTNSLTASGAYFGQGGVESGSQYSLMMA
jgi:hypothetical protein